MYVVDLGFWSLELERSFVASLFILNKISCPSVVFVLASCGDGGSFVGAMRYCLESCLPNLTQIHLNKTVATAFASNDRLRQQHRQTK